MSIQIPKTKSAYRQMDVCTAIAKLIKQFVGDRQSGLLFTNRIGGPLFQTYVVRRSLHPILEEVEVEKTGFHAMRRFRATWLRKQRTPEDLIRFFWLGHAKSSLTGVVESKCLFWCRLRIIGRRLIRTMILNETYIQKSYLQQLIFLTD